MKKTFDAVNFQRKVRAELSKQYLENREAFLTELKEKYGKLKKSGESAHTSDNTGTKLVLINPSGLFCAAHVICSVRAG